MTNGNVELFRIGLKAFEDGGLEGLLPLMHEDIQVFADATVLNAGSFEGHEGFMRWSNEWFEAWSDVSYEPVDFIEVSASILVVPTIQKAVGTLSGIPVEQEIVWLIQFRGEKISRFHLYNNREQAVEVASELAGAGEAPAEPA